MLAKLAASFLLFFLLATTAHAKVPSAGYTLEAKETAQGKTSYPVLNAVKDPAIRDAINQEIATEAAGWACEEGDGDKATFNALSTVQYLDANLFSYTVDYDYYCGGPYPDARRETRTYDLTSGKLLTREDVLNDKLADDEFFAFLLKNRINTDALEEECEGEIAAGYPWNFYVTPETIVFQPDMPHATRGCAVEFAIPKAKMAPFLKTDSVLK